MSPREDLAQAYRDWVKALNDRNIDLISGSVADTVMHDDQESTREQYIRHILDTLYSSSVDSIELDMVTVDVVACATAARLIYSGTPQKSDHGVSATNKAVEWSEYTFTWFNTEQKVIRTETLIDRDAFRAGTVEVPRTPNPQYAPPPPTFDIKGMYRGYLNTINSQTTKENLPRFCQPIVTHNMQVSSLDEYRSFIVDSFKQIEGMKLDVLELVTDEVLQHVAAKLELSGKPVGEFMGIPPTGRTVRFLEHAFYKLDGGKIAYVWAMRDFDTYKKCLAGTN